jgi:hypothetical protein
MERLVRLGPLYNANSYIQEIKKTKKEKERLAVSPPAVCVEKIEKTLQKSINLLQ